MTVQLIAGRDDVLISSSSPKHWALVPCEPRRWLRAQICDALTVLALMHPHESPLTTAEIQTCETCRSTCCQTRKKAEGTSPAAGERWRCGVLMRWHRLHCLLLVCLRKRALKSYIFRALVRKRGWIQGARRLLGHVRSMQTPCMPRRLRACDEPHWACDIHSLYGRCDLGSQSRAFGHWTV